MGSVIFDLDGTLIDSAPDIHAAINAALAEEGAAPLSLAQVISFIGNGMPTLVQRVMDARGEAPDAARHAALLARFLAQYTAAATLLTRLYPGAEAALRALAAEGWAIGLCTNKPEAPARAILADFGLTDLFAVVIGGDSLAERKPHPAPLVAAVAALGPGPAVYVGDSEVDAETAAAAGLPFALYTEGYRKAAVADLAHDAAFADFATLPGIVAALAQKGA
jgi:phosphoglycolate phosphatase